MTDHIKTHFNTTSLFQTRQSINKRYTVGPDFKTLVERRLKLDERESMLDVGCCPGHFLGKLKQCGHMGHLEDLDLAEGMVPLTHSIYPSVEFRVRSADNQLLYEEQWRMHAIQKILFNGGVQ